MLCRRVILGDMTQQASALAAYLSVAQAAVELATRQHTVLAWIATGELPASNIAPKRGTRPRWRISRIDLERFLASRRAVQAEPAGKPRRRVEPAVAIT